MVHHKPFYKYLAALTVVAAFANQAHAQSNACDLDGSGAVNITDVNRAVSMALGTTPCTASIEAQNTCTIVTVQRVVNAALGQACSTFNTVIRTVELTWLPSPTTGVTGYNVYRRTSATGTAVKLNTVPVTGTTFTDTAVQLGLTYYYSATAVGSNGLESTQSSQAIAVIPAS